MKNTFTLKVLICTVMLAALSLKIAAQQVCTNDSTGQIPINDLGSGYYNGFQGGLYPGGSNYRPSAHMSTGLSAAQQVLPRDSSGNVDTANGKIVMMSIGFSNPAMEFTTFIPLANAFPGVNPKVVFLNGAKGGQSSNIIDDPNYEYWDTVNTRLADAGLHPEQVQVIWFKGIFPVGPNNPMTFDAFTDSLRVQFKKIMNNTMSYFPNVKICYLASRIYAGYNGDSLSYEPYAYWNGWATKWVIEDQITGDTLLTPGVNSPWLCWGTYNWADGTNPRSDSLVWLCPADFNSDGRHPSAAGRTKVANMLLNFLATDSTACPWFYANGCSYPTGILQNENDPGGRIKIFPNPANTSFSILLSDELNNSAIEVVIYNSLGQQVYQDKRQSVDGKIEISSMKLAPGIYNVVLRSHSTVLTQKLIIKN